MRSLTESFTETVSWVGAAADSDMTKRGLRRQGLGQEGGWGQEGPKDDTHNCWCEERSVGPALGTGTGHWHSG